MLTVYRDRSIDRETEKEREMETGRGRATKLWTLLFDKYFGIQNAVRNRVALWRINSGVFVWKHRRRQRERERVR